MKYKLIMANYNNTQSKHKKLFLGIKDDVLDIYNTIMVEHKHFYYMKIRDEVLPSRKGFVFRGVRMTEDQYWDSISVDGRAIKIALMNPGKINKYLLNTKNRKVHYFLKIYPEFLDKNHLSKNKYVNKKILYNNNHKVTWDAINTFPILQNFINKDLEKINWSYKKSLSPFIINKPIDM